MSQSTSDHSILTGVKEYGSILKMNLKKSASCQKNPFPVLTYSPGFPSTQCYHKQANKYVSSTASTHSLNIKPASKGWGRSFPVSSTGLLQAEVAQSSMAAWHRLSVLVGALFHGHRGSRPTNKGCLRGLVWVPGGKGSNEDMRKKKLKYWKLYFSSNDC